MQAPFDLPQLVVLEPIALPFDNPCEESIHILSSRAKPLIRLYATGQSTGAQEAEGRTILHTLNQKRFYEFIQAVNREIESLNPLIIEYNATNDLALKAMILQEISALYATLDARYPESVINRSPEYRTQFYDRLAPEIRQHTAHLAQISTDMPQPAYPDRLSELLQKMPQDKLNRFLAILCNNTDYNDELKYLYDPSDPNYPEFKAFLETHSISFLAGHNINNFYIKQIGSDNPPYILKIEYRLNQPKDIAQSLYEEVDNFIQPSWSLRAHTQRTDLDGKEETVVRTIMTGPYFPEGNLRDVSMRYARPFEKIEHALNIYTQMAEVLTKIDQAGGVFPDMKNTNWLIHDGKLFIGDDKSVRRHDADGYIDVFSEDSQWYGDILKSPECMPPEVFNTTPIQVEALHAFSWAKNLYEFLIADPNSHDFRYQKIMEGEQFNFNYPLFRIKPEGHLLKQLIIAMVRINPERRLTLQQGNDCLAHIKLISCVREHVMASITPPVPYEISAIYLNDILQLDREKLEPYRSMDKEALKADVQPYIDTYSAQYKTKFANTIQEIESILSQHPHEELRQALVAVKMERNCLDLSCYMQFDADLNELLQAAEQIALDSALTHVDKSLDSADESDDNSCIP